MNRRRFFRRVATALAALPFVGRMVAKTSTTASDRDYMETVQFSKEQICRIFAVSPHFVRAIGETSRIAEAASARARKRLLDQLINSAKRQSKEKKKQPQYA
jgi:phage portal protein BeeE